MAKKLEISNFFFSTSFIVTFQQLSFSPCMSKITLPTRLPTSTPTVKQSTTDSANQSLTTAPSYSSTKAPTQAPTDSNVIEGNIYLFYKHHVEDVLSLSLLGYAEDLADATKEALRFITNETSFQLMCDQFNLTTEDVNNDHDIPFAKRDNNCFLSNFNPYVNSGDDSDNGSTRRRMLNEYYSYKYDDFDNGSSGWWQGRMENLQYCTVFKIEWGPTDCGDFNTDIVDNTAEYVLDPEQVQYAFGTFVLLQMKTV